jgi:hypothetical protein
LVQQEQVELLLLETHRDQVAEMVDLQPLVDSLHSVLVLVEALHRVVQVEQRLVVLVDLLVEQA